MLDRIALLIGLFVVPIVLLRLGDSLRKKTMRRRRVFWGAVIGHSTGMVVTFFAAMLPPIGWHGGGPARIVVVHWAMLVGAAAGAAVALLGSRATEPEPEPSQRPASRREPAVAREAD